MPTKKKADPERGGGRENFVLTAAKLKLARASAKQGMFEKDIARLLGFHPNYFSEIKRRHPELVEEMQFGRAEQIKEATRVVAKHLKKDSLAAAMYVLKCRGGYREDGREPDNDSETRNSQSTSERILANIRKHRDRKPA